MTHASLWRRNGYQGVTKQAAVTMASRRILQSGCFKAIFRAISALTHWDRVTHIGVSKIIIIASDNGLSPSRRQAIIWINDGILLIGPLGANFSGTLIEIRKFSFNKMHLKMSSAKWHLFRLGLNELTHPNLHKFSMLYGWRHSVWKSRYQLL